MRIRNLIVIATLIISFLIMTNVLLAVPGTYQVFTGNCDWFVERVIYLEEGPYVASVVDTANIWDITMGSDPVPWSKLYQRDNARWLSWSIDGIDSFAPESLGAFLYCYYSPPFKVYDNISRATLWIAVDDWVVGAYLRNLEDTSLVDLHIFDTTSCFSQLARYDVTEAFRSCSNGSYDPAYQLEMFVCNTISHPTGIIAYLSYDFVQYGTSPTAFSYRIPPGEGVYEFSLPFYPVGDSVTLKSLFNDEITAAWVYNESTGGLSQSIDIDQLLTGSGAASVADSLRTYSLKAEFIDEHSFYTIYGYPILEQRYLDRRGNNPLWFGSTNCSVPFSGNSPDDYPDNIYFGYRTAEYTSSNGYPGYTDPVSTVEPRLAYASYVSLSVDSSNLDLSCNYNVYPCFSVELDGLSTQFFGYTEEFLKQLFSKIPHTQSDNDSLK